MSACKLNLLALVNLIVYNGQPLAWRKTKIKIIFPKAMVFDPWVGAFKWVTEHHPLLLVHIYGEQG